MGHAGDLPFVPRDSRGRMAAAPPLGCHMTHIKLLGLLALAAVSLRAESYFLTVAGLGGEDQYDQRFTGWASDLNKLLKAEPGAKVDTLSGKDATKANIEAKLRALANTKPDDSFVLVLIGHGTYDDLDYKFNIPGPDISATELAGLLDKIRSEEHTSELQSRRDLVCRLLLEKKKKKKTNKQKKKHNKQ